MPKLMFLLKDFKADPSDQKIDELVTFLKWKPMLRYESFMVILET